MKMTRLEWRYLQRIALDHPYYDTHTPPLSDAEAKAIVEENNVMSGREFVDSIYAKIGMSRQDEEKKRLTWLHSIGELLAVPPIRKLAIAVLVVLLMTVFFAATPAGRTIAESVIQYVVSLFGDGILVVNQNDSKTIMISVDTAPNPEKVETLEQRSSIVSVNTFEEFTAKTGVQPTVLSFPHTELYYDRDASTDYLMLHAEYATPRGKIITYQIWNMMNLMSTTSAGFSVCDADPSVYYSVEENGTTTIMKLYEDSVLGIVAEGGYTVDEIIGFLTIE